MPGDAPLDPADLRRFKLSDEEIGFFFDAINRCVADEERLKSQIAIVRQGKPLTDRLELSGAQHWFQPMLNDLMRQGVSVVINDISIADDLAAVIADKAGLPADWVTQQNLYITPEDSQGFDPHCDPHIVVVAHIYGRKEWTFYDRALDNPVYDTDTRTVADKTSPPPVKGRIIVEPGDCFVIPRGLYHSAVALSPASIHMAVGTAGARPVDHIWAVADRALKDSAMRADMSPEEARLAAERFMADCAVGDLQLPRFPRAPWKSDGSVSELSFASIVEGLDTQ